MTAGLEAKLLMAVGVRVMLRRNIDTNAGLVNGAIGAVVSIRPNHITVQFDHVNKPYNVGQEQIHNREKFLHLHKTVSTYLCIRCDHPQAPRLVVRLCLSRPLGRSVQCWNGLRSNITSLNATRVTPGRVRARIYHGQH